ncbi:MAG: recombinase XerC [Acidobacteria bacterium]|nr:tyrosine-type recombinase/integrase [Acidobacteriota bacterium]TDI12468.1 MAG: recombinase XerC [Acidobacteriota bacterium]
MTERLYKLLSRRHAGRAPRMPWVFWHTYVSKKTGKRCEGPYDRRKRLMKGLCKKAGVRYFNFHALRHSGASVMDSLGVPIGSIQRILGHQQRRTTENYLQSIGDSERQAMAMFEEASTNSHTDSHTAVVSKRRWGG